MLGSLRFESTENQDSVRECGGIAALVALLAPGSSSALHELAAGALCVVCAGNTQNQDCVRECGGVAALVGLLAPGGSAAAQREAAAALCNLCSENTQNQD